MAGLLTPGSAKPPEGVWDRIAVSLEHKPPPLHLALAVPLRPTRGVGLRAAAVVAAVAAIIIGLMGATILNDGRRLDRVAAGVHSQGLERAANAALVDPGANKVSLRSEDGVWFADVVMLDDGTGYLFKHNLPLLSGDRTYQLWALGGANKISMGTVGPAPKVAAFHVAEPVWGLAITEEPAGGVVSTERVPVVLGRTNA